MQKEMSSLENSCLILKTIYKRIIYARCFLSTTQLYNARKHEFSQASSYYSILK